jgi:hypothetical protein
MIFHLLQDTVIQIQLFLAYSPKPWYKVNITPSSENFSRLGVLKVFSHYYDLKVHLIQGLT